MKDNTGTKKVSVQILASILVVSILYFSAQDVLAVTRGTQNWIAKFTMTWGAALVGLILLGLIILVYGLLNLWEVGWVIPANKFLVSARARTQWLCWILIPLFAFLPAKILMYTPLGAKFSGIGFRLSIFLVSAVILSILATSSHRVLISMQGALIGLVLIGSVFAVAKAFVSVVDHPLSLTWSEGNRIWDYSIFFGRDIYNYPADQPIEAYIDRARQTLWGLPFLIPGINIQSVRFWSALVFTLPYVLLGWILFQSLSGQDREWVWLGLWSFLFLDQGPIYTPLILSAILVAGSRRKPLWIALPLIYLAGYYAQSSRITWMIAPAMFALITAMMDNYDLGNKHAPVKKWGKIATYGIAGFIGGFGIIRGWRRLYNYITRAASSNTAAVTPSLPAATFIHPSDSVETLSSVGQTSALSSQPLIWERLFPNPTYGLGILLGLFIASAPIIILLVYFVRKKLWKLDIYQAICIVGILVSLMGLGIFISTKIGGGGDLHNLDMFFIAALFTTAFAWQSGGREFLSNLESRPIGIQLTILLVAAVPAFMPWINAAPLELPPQDKTEWTLELLKSETERVVAEGGEVLFMDQRQLLTFGYLGQIPLVPEYEKKLVMDKAMSGDKDYFEQFYKDIADQRFDLIVTDPQRIRFSDEDEGWGAENDTWVQWVTKPLLCYYEPAFTIKKTGVWLLHPVEDISGCRIP